MIRRLLLLNGFAIIGVVLNHTAGWGFTALFWWTHRYQPVSVPNFDQLGGASYYGLRFIEQLIIFAIPAFLFVSGFFIASATGRTRENVDWKVVLTRISNLVIPYLIWSFVFIGFDMVQGADYSGSNILRRVAFGRATTGYYYVPLLIQYFLLAPLIVPLAKKRWRLLLIGSAFLQAAVLLLRYPAIMGTQAPFVNQLVAWSPSWFFPGHIFWFSAGVVIGFNMTEFKELLQRIKWGALIVTLITFLAGMVEWELLLQASSQEWIPPTRTIIDDLMSGAFLLAFLGFEGISYPYSKQLGQLGAKSYGIYLGHTLAIIVAARVIYHFLPGVLGIQSLFQVLLIIVALAAPLGLMWVVNRSPARPIYRYLFG